MDFGFKQYIDYNQDYKGIPVYGQPEWIPSGVNFMGQNVVDIPLDANDLTTFILIHQITYATTGTGIPTHFVDSRWPAIRIFTLGNFVASDNVANFKMIIKGNTFKMVCTDVACFFSLLVQKVTQEPER